MKNKQLEHLKFHLQGKAVILGIGNRMRSDDAVGSILAERLKGKLPFAVWDAGVSPENYLGKLVKENPDSIVLVDAVDFSAKPGEFAVLEAEDVKTTNIFTTHNASISLIINYLKSEIKADIIILIIQPKIISLGETLSLEIKQTLEILENWFLRVPLENT